MKVVFLFMSRSCATPGSTSRVKPQHECSPMYKRQNGEEGYFALLQRLVDYKIITDLKVFYESNIGAGIARFVNGPNVYCEVIPEIRFVEEYIDDETIIFVRGGFKHWHNFLLQYKGKNWLMLYAANTGRERWPFWDVILDDINEVNYIDGHDRYWHNFVKPINEDIFYPAEGFKPMKYDFCIGASHIHDKKGQYLAIEALKEYNKIYGELRLVMPGSTRGGANTRKMIERMSFVNNVFAPGFVERHELRKIFQESKYFLHLGAHGQNDRGPLEALACGTPVCISSPKYHAPFLSLNGNVIKNRESPRLLALHLHDLLRGYSPELRKNASATYHKYSSFEEVVVPKFSNLLLMMHAHGKPTPETKEKIRGVFANVEVGEAL